MAYKEEKIEVENMKGKVILYLKFKKFIKYRCIVQNEM